MEIEWNGIRLFYSKTGTGPENLLLFHGFGQHRTVFNDLAHQITSRYTCYSFDLFFHGEDSHTRYSKPISTEEWNALLSAFLTHENIRRFSMLGFSIGARLVLSAIPLFMTRLNTVYLIAPEGITTNIWYRLATATKPGRYVFRRFVQRPGYFFAAAEGVERMGLLPAKVGRFARKMMESDAKRRRVYDTWMMLSELKTDQQELIESLNNASIRVVIILGKRDRIIPAAPILEFARKLRQKAVVHQINSAHVPMIRNVSKDCDKIFISGSDIQY